MKIFLTFFPPKCLIKRTALLREFWFPGEFKRTGDGVVQHGPAGKMLATHIENRGTGEMFSLGV